MCYLHIQDGPPLFEERLGGKFTYSEREIMKDIKLILNIQLFADGGNEGGTEEFGMRNLEFGMKENEGTDVLDDGAKECGMRSAECGMNEEGNSDGLNNEASKCGMRNSEFGMDEEGSSDGLNNEASDEDEEVVTEDADEDEIISEREERLRNRISGWLKESGEIKEVYPDFDLRNELRSSKLFAQLVLAGAPLKASYEIVHKDEIISGAMAYTADKVREQVVKNIETKGRRPLENGISSESAVITAIDVNALTAKDIHKILKQVENGASIKF